MRIIFHTPFKPLDYPKASGDVTQARELYGFLAARGHELIDTPFLDCDWIYLRPGAWPGVLAGQRRAKRLIQRTRPHLWLTYHSYYRAPDILGPLCTCQNLPYVIYNAAYATKRRRRVKTRAGFHLNRLALKSADLVYANNRENHLNLARVVKPEHLKSIRQGLDTNSFAPDAEGGAEVRKNLGLGDGPVVITVAMLRRGVKERGVREVIEASAALNNRGLGHKLLLVGDGPAWGDLKSLAERKLGERAVFCGQVPRDEMAAYLSAADLFAFPGIDESLGMAFLEAQACGLPVVAWDHAAAPEAVEDGVSGFITPSFDRPAFIEAIGRLLRGESLLTSMSHAARKYVLANHDITRNFLTLERDLINLAKKADTARSRT